MFLNLYIHNVTLVTSPSEVLGHLEVIRKELMLPPRGVHADSLPFFQFLTLHWASYLSHGN